MKVDVGGHLSLIVAAHNAERTLPECLESIQKSQLRPLETIVVDDHSSDGTADIARRHGCIVLSTGKRSGPARARNLGAAHARGGVLIFLDSDVCLHPKTLAHLTSHFKDRAIGAAFGAYDDDPSDPGFFSRYRNLLHCYTHRVGRPNAGTFWAGCGAIRRDVFQSFEGFDERYEHASIEDIELGMRLAAAGVSIRLDPNAQTKHLKRWTLPAMSRTDILRRGIPWAKLLLERGRMPNDLNLRWSQRISVGAAWMALPAACTGHVWFFAATLATIAACNWRFLNFLGRRQGWTFPVRAFPVQVLFSFYCGVAFALALGLHLKSQLAEYFPSLLNTKTPA